VEIIASNFRKIHLARTGVVTHGNERHKLEPLIQPLVPFSPWLLEWPYKIILRTHVGFSLFTLTDNFGTITFLEKLP
jgi:hypothetical protein